MKTDEGKQREGDSKNSQRVPSTVRVIFLCLSACNIQTSGLPFFPAVYVTNRIFFSHLVLSSHNLSYLSSLASRTPNMKVMICSSNVWVKKRNNKRSLPEVSLSKSSLSIKASGL